MSILNRIDYLFENTLRHPDWGQCILAIFSALILEMVARASILSALVWAVTMPHRLTVMVLLLLVFIRAVLALTGSFRVSWMVVFMPSLLLSLLHATKFIARNEPLFPWDLFLFNEGKAIMKLEFFPLPPIQIAVVAILLAAVFWMAWSLPQKRVNISSRVFSLVLLMAIVTSIFGLRHMDSYREFCLRSGFHHWNQNLTTARFGFLPTFLMNLPIAAVIPPPGYSSERAAEILSQFKHHSHDAESKLSGEPINLIIFLAEGFWDPVGLKKIMFKKEPVANFRSVLQDHASLDLISPVLAGNTCNAELELLTGLNMAFFPAGSIPYQQYIRGGVDSLASILARNGYRSIAIHPFHKWFFNRDRVYPLLGFQQFIAKESMTHTKINGDFISDMSLSREIIDVADSTTGPFFIFAVSMENHSPYQPDRYENKFEDAGLDQANEILDSRQLRILKTYITGIHHADLALGTLIDHFSKLPRKTMIVFLGDHLPFLDAGYRIFKNAGYLDTDKMFPKMFTQKAVIWTNYKAEKFTPKTPISFSYVPAILLEKIGISLPPFLKIVVSTMQSHPVIHQDLILPSLVKYKIIQHDAIFNKKKP